MNSQITFAAGQIYQQRLRQSTQQAQMSGTPAHRFSFSLRRIRFPRTATAQLRTV
jgi:hypothetical protein